MNSADDHRRSNPVAPAPRAAARGGLRDTLLVALAAIALATPSIWFVATIPPLWRDIDAYIQTTGRPDPTTVLLHGPLYSALARWPLYLGYVLENRGSSDLRGLGDFLLRPSLSDSGVFALLLLQHAALLAAHLYFVTAVTRLSWLRLVLALALAANPLLYAFAHCVGSETLNAIGFVVLTAFALRLVRREGNPTARQWIVWAVLLVLLMLTRQINAVLVVMLPLALVPLIWRRSGPNPSARAGLQRVAMAALIGLTCFAISLGCVRLIALAADTTYRSKIGFTFVWRLMFLQTISPAERAGIIEAAAAAARSPETKALTLALGEAFAKPEPLDVPEFIRGQRVALFPPGSEEVTERTDHALNGVPLAFAIGSPGALTTAAVKDFVIARRATVPQLTEFLFWSTAYHFGREEAMPEFGKLVTYRGSSAEAIIATGRRQSYLRWWTGVTYDWWFAAWAVALAALFVVARVRRVDVTSTCAYATALVLTGLLMVLLNCFLSELLPRYTLPMLQLTFLSLLILLSRIAEVSTAARQTSPPS